MTENRRKRIMKAIIKGLISLLCVGTIAFSATACTKEIINAYDIAVKNGFVGTEQEWLASLRGKDGEDAPKITAKDLYEQAKQEGFTGSYIEFCEKIGITAVEDNDVKQIAQNMMSVVEIFCGWTKTTVEGGLVANKTVEHTMTVGSGVIIDLNKEAGNALIITNYHVVYNKDSDAKGICDLMKVYLHGAVRGLYEDETTHEFTDGGADAMTATFVGGAMDYDVAILKIEGSEYLRKSNATKATPCTTESTEGEKVFVIGNPDGAGISVTSGAVSVKSEYINIEAIDGRNKDGVPGVDLVSYRVMRTDAAINGGNSGGGLFNAKGELIGITNAKSVGTDKDDMGYALPILDVMAVYNNIMDHGRGYVVRPMLGVMVGIESGMAELENGVLNVVETISVAAEVERGVCAYGKLMEGDIFRAGQIIGKMAEPLQLNRRYQLNAFLLNVRYGDSVKLWITRRVYTYTVQMPNGAMKEETSNKLPEGYTGEYDLELVDMEVTLEFNSTGFFTIYR